MGFSTPEAEALFRDNRRLVGKVVSRMRGRHWHRVASVGEDDLIQEGLIALASACEDFDPARGVKFSVFAVPRMRARIARSINESGLIHVPDWARFAAIRWGKAAMAMPGAAESEIAAAAGVDRVSIDKVKAAHRVLVAGWAGPASHQFLRSRDPTPLEVLARRDDVAALEAHERRRRREAVRASARRSYLRRRDRAADPAIAS